MKQTSIKVFSIIILAALLTACTTVPGGISSSSQAQIIPPLTVPVSSDATSVLPYESPIDFNELITKGADICAWLEVSGTNIDYPVTMGIDNAYYLTHNAYGEYYAGGAVFIDMINSADFSDAVTVMYGHVMPDDTIFSQLHLFKDPAFFEENRAVTVYLPDNCYTYEIFAAFPHDASNFLYERYYTDSAVFEELLAYIRQRGVDAPGDTNLAMDGVGADDRLLLLSTCDNEGVSRYILAARLIEMAA